MESSLSAYALAGAYALLTLSAVFAWMHASQREAGARWFCLAYLLGGLIYLFDAKLRPGGTVATRATIALATPAFALLALGLLDYLSVPRHQRLRWLSGVILPPLAVIALQALAPLPRTGPVSALSLSMCVLAVACWQASRRERGVGHAIVAIVLLSYPLAFLVCLSLRVPVQVFRYAMILPVTATGLTLIVISLSRARLRLQRELGLRASAQRELRALNTELERRVEQRTAELHDVIEGLDSFNRMVSHDLRAPLAGIAGLADLVRRAYDEGHPERARELLGLIGMQTRRLADLVHDLLVLGRLSEDRLELRLASLDEPLREAMQTLALSAGEQRIMSQVTTMPLPVARFDPSLIRQVFVNLIGNALKFTHDTASPSIHVAGVRQGADVVLSVRDNGAGFDMARAGELFQPFRRLHSQYEGTGLGLTIVRRIVERHGGRAWAESHPGEGTTFYFTLTA